MIAKRQSLFPFWKGLGVGHYNIKILNAIAITRQKVLKTAPHFKNYSHQLFNSIKVIIVIAILFLFNACEKEKPYAVGYDEKVVVLVEEDMWEEVEALLNKHVGHDIRTPIPEQWYYFHRATPEQFVAQKNMKNLMIISDLRPNSRITKFIQQMLPDSTLIASQKNKRHIIMSENAFAREQSFTAILGKNRQRTYDKIFYKGNDILKHLDDVDLKRQTRFLFRTGEQEDLADAYEKEHGYHIRMMHDFIEIENRPDEHFLWVGRDIPYRWLMVYWEDVHGAIDQDRLAKKMMNKVMGRLIPDIEISPKMPIKSSDHLIGTYATTEYRGLWQHRIDTKGGPFLSYAFFEPTQNRMYLLTGLVFAPERNKLPFLKQLEVLMHTFEVR